MTANLLALPILLPLATAIVCLVLSGRPDWRRGAFVAGNVLSTLAAFAVFSNTMESGHLVLALGSWPAPIGIVLVADLFSSVMVVVSTTLGLLIGIYALADISPLLQKRHFFSLFHFLMMGVNGAFLTGDLFNLYVWFEVMLISSFVLLVIGGEKPQLEGGLKYVALNLFSSALFLTAAGLLYAKVGTLNMADIATKLAAAPNAFFMESTAMVLFVAFGLKAAAFPLFFWLPASYHTPPASVSAIFAGLLTKVGVYALVRLFSLLYYTDATDARAVLAWIAGLTMFVGVCGAAAQFNFRKVLSFHIVSQIGYMLMGLALFTPLALAGMIFYLVHHIIVKANLFLVGGCVETACGTGNLKQTGGLYRAAPLLSLLFFIPAFSLGGIPPLSGFWAKFAVLRAGMESEAWWLVATGIVVGLITLFSMTKLWNESFWKSKPDQEVLPPAALSQASSFTRLFPIGVMALITLAIGFAGQPLFEFSVMAAEQLLQPEAYIEAVLPKGSNPTVDSPHP